jgi:hypothetical protein
MFFPFPGEFDSFFLVQRRDFGLLARAVGPQIGSWNTRCTVRLDTLEPLALKCLTALLGDRYFLPLVQARSLRFKAGEMGGRPDPFHHCLDQLPVTAEFPHDGRHSPPGLVERLDLDSPHFPSGGTYIG